jgi:hypothetical protein
MYKFIRKANEYGSGIKHKVETDYDTWFELVEEFQKFLNKCGYIFVEDFDMSHILRTAHTKAFKKEEKKRKELK